VCMCHVISHGGGGDNVVYALRCTTPCAWRSERERASCCARGRTLCSVRLGPLLMIMSRRDKDWDVLWLRSPALLHRDMSELGDNKLVWLC
jgi:hypothetical protein